MNETVRFYLDEHIFPAIADGLRRRNIDVATPAEVGLLGAEDEMQLQFARQSRRIMVSQDADFLRLHTLGHSHMGIAYCRQGSRTVGEMLHTLVLIYDLMTAEEMIGKVVYL